VSKRSARIAIGIDLESPYKHHAELVGGILQYASQKGWACHFEPFIGPVRGILGASRYDGVIARFTRAGANYVRRNRIPAVNVWLGSPDRSLPRVVSDQHATGRLAAQHLVERGFRRFGFLGYRRERNGVLQLAGFKEEIATVQGACSTHAIAMAPTGRQEWHRQQASLMKWAKSFEKPIGVFVTQDLACRYLAQVCQLLGYRMPDDVALMGSGNDELLCESLDPKISSIEHRPAAVGCAAAELLNKLMRGAAPPKKPILIAPSGLVPRTSTDFYAVDDVTVTAALRFMQEHCAEPIGVGDVAAVVHMTRRSLERRFRAVLGRSVHGEITRLRIERAKRLLVERSDPIKRAALDAGFSSTEHLSKVFRRHVGTSPGDYRRAHQAVMMAKGVMEPGG